MEPSQRYLQHNPRYVPFSPNYPPPPPPPVSDNRYFYDHHHHLHPPPPPPPPQSQQFQPISRYSLPTPPPPPLTSPTIPYDYPFAPNPNFPIEDAMQSRSNINRYGSIDNQRPFHYHSTQYALSEPDLFCDPHPYPTTNMDLDRIQFNKPAVSPYRSTERISNENFLQDRVVWNSQVDRSRELRTSVMGNYDNGVSVYDNNSNQRRGESRKAMREVHNSLVDYRNDKIGNADGFQPGLGKHEYNSELDRYANNQILEAYHDQLDHVSRNKLQKKSALLRIQKPKPNNKKRENKHHKGHFSDTKSSPFKGKDRGVEENARAASAVELDVSFKSNSLVATLPPENFAKSSKIRKVTVSKIDSSGSQVVKTDGRMIIPVSNSPGENESSSNKVENTEVKDNGLMSSSRVVKLESAVKSASIFRTTKNVIPEIADDVAVSGSKPSSISDVSPGKRKAENAGKVVKCAVKSDISYYTEKDSFDSKEIVKSDSRDNVGTSSVLQVVKPSECSVKSEIASFPDNNNSNSNHCEDNVDTAIEKTEVSVTLTVSGNGSKQTAPKKKKVRRKRVKKPRNPTKKLDEILKVGIVCCQSTTSKPGSLIETLGENITKAGNSSGHYSDTQSCSNVISAHRCKRVDELPQTVISKEVNRNLDSEELSLQNVKRKCNDLVSPLDCSTRKHMKLDEVFANADNLVTLAYTDEGTSKQACETESSLLLECGSPVLSSEVVFSLVSTSNSSLLSSKKNNSYEVLQNTSSTTAETESNERVGKGSMKPLEKSVYTDFESRKVISSHTCASQIYETDADGMETVSQVGDMLPLVGPEKRKFEDIKLDTECSDHVKGITRGPKLCCFRPQEANHKTSTNTVDLHHQGANIHESGAGVRSGDFSISEEVSNEHGSYGANEVMLSSQIINLHVPPQNVANSVSCVDTNIGVASVPSVDVSSTRVAVGFGELNQSNSVNRLLEAKKVKLERDGDISTTNRDDKRTSSPEVPVASVINKEPVSGFLISPAKVQSEVNEGLILPEEVAISFRTLESKCEHAESGISLAGNYQEKNVLNGQYDKGERKDAYTGCAKSLIVNNTAGDNIPIKSHCLAVDENIPKAEMRDASYLLNDVLSVSNHLSFESEVPTPNYCEEQREIVPTLSDNYSLPLIIDLAASRKQCSGVNICQDDEIPNEKPLTRGVFSSSNKFDIKRDHVWERNNSTSKKEFPSHYSNITSTHGGKIHPSYAPPKNPGHYSSLLTASATSPTLFTQARTWNRSTISSASLLPNNKPISNTAPSQGQFPKRSSKLLDNSYIRKGNSLVRKPPAAFSSFVYQLNSSVTDKMKKGSGFENDVDGHGTVTSNFVGTGVGNSSFERPRTPPLSRITKIPNRSMTCSQDPSSSPLADTINGSTEIMSQKWAESGDALYGSKDLSKISAAPEYQTSSTNNFKIHNNICDGNYVSSRVKSITYVKRKSNQLIAAIATKPGFHSDQNAENNLAASSDGYYKKRGNQLIRSPFESNTNQIGTLRDTAFTSKGPTTSEVQPRSRRKRKAVTKSIKPSNFSLVWTLHGEQSSKKNNASLNPQTPPHLPWKRMTYWRKFSQSPDFVSNNSSLSTISRKLLLSRKRDAVYTRSRNGYSLRKFKVLGVGGSSLKWSKSIDRHSKKAHEEATLAVAAVDRKMKEEKITASGVSGTKNRNSSSARARIFRIGILRYKMDSSRRTLQRISDGEPSTPPVLQKEMVGSPYVPRRLVIGSNQYIRIGNGNQLVRDPKKRTRILASEKVRWSLHTVRSRMARKRKYCQFFTRFGKCRKDDGKCPYIHDSSKVAVCTKFLNGLCRNSNCKLTHKVIPDRMPDCSYFLQGLCTNKSCTYRHVQVNPHSPTCEGFLKGYCADGNECRKKHSYVCPSFEATGACILGLKCKLHHPKNRNKETRALQKNNARRRYFGGSATTNGGKATTFEMNSLPDISLEREFGDFISIGYSDEEDGECGSSPISEHIHGGSDVMDLQVDEFPRGVIKPIGIMKEKVDTFSPMVCLDTEELTACL